MEPDEGEVRDIRRECCAGVSGWISLGRQA